MRYGLAAFDPKIIPGDRRRVEDIILPATVTDLVRWEQGFDAGLAASPPLTYTVDRADVRLHLHPRVGSNRGSYTDAFLDGRAIGVEARKHLGTEQMVREMLKEQYRKIARGEVGPNRKVANLTEREAEALAKAGRGEKLSESDLVMFYAASSATTRTKAYTDSGLRVEGRLLYSVDAVIAAKSKRSEGVVFIALHVQGEDMRRHLAIVAAELRRTGWTVKHRVDPEKAKS